VLVSKLTTYIIFIIYKIGVRAKKVDALAKYESTFIYI